MRIIEISKLINNEKIEVIEYSNDFNRLAYNCCLPVELQGIIIDEPENPKEKRNITLVVKDADLPLIIGKKGFNTWIISQLLNADIDTLAYEDAVEGKIEFTPISVEKNTRRSNIKRNDHHVKVNNVTTKRINDEFIDNLDFTDEFNDDKGKKKQKNNSYE
jgi:transcription antitermination factor NusA-like protein